MDGRNGKKRCWMAKCELGLNFIAVFLGFVSALM